MGSLDGKTAFITGAARGQGRAHALRLAGEGASIIAIDICKQIDTVPYAMSTSEDLAETVRLVEEVGGRIFACEADVRDAVALQDAVDAGVAALGGLDIVVANAGIMAPGAPDTEDGSIFRDVVDVNTIGVWNTARIALPYIRRGGRGGAMVLVSSTQGVAARGADGTEAITAYAASKHAVVGIMRSMAATCGKDSIRINTLHPTGIPTPMVANPQVAEWMATNPDDLAAMGSHLLPVETIETIDTANAVLYLVSESGRYVTGVTFMVDAGLMAS
ncbi:mycofactocin-coupled SDR family oxidoreductase [Nocardia rhamnosiphila]|uniref:Mycofactocin-coupled SDR family oxidoreductase n=1 Tax=Nocardia rhamnosiphila TaxID=426716 RepID=A0ABV2WR98_9NOCA